jgi:hypothetical protein
LCEAVRVYTRYETPDEKGVTRRQRYERIQQPVPLFYIPEAGKYLWDWFRELNFSVTRIKDGQCCLIPPSEVLAWINLTGTIIYPSEYDILRAMDHEYCSEINKELRAMYNVRCS